MTLLSRRIAFGLAGVLLIAVPAAAQDCDPAKGTRTLGSRFDFDTLLKRVEKSVADNGMTLVAQASASRGAAGRGVKIPGNAVVMVFRNDFAVRMLEVSAAAGIEAPLRLYVVENANGTATLSYRPPTVVFAPYHAAKLDALARELDPIFQKIADQAVGS